jgi:hypothetical protein
MSGSFGPYRLFHVRVISSFVENNKRILNMERFDSRQCDLDRKLFEALFKPKELPVQVCRQRWKLKHHLDFLHLNTSHIHTCIGILVVK